MEYKILLLHLQFIIWKKNSLIAVSKKGHSKKYQFTIIIEVRQTYISFFFIIITRLKSQYLADHMEISKDHKRTADQRLRITVLNLHHNHYFKKQEN